MFEVEKKVLSLFFKDVGFDSPTVENILLKSAVVNREIDSAGFYTTISIPEQYRNAFIDNPNWSKANGKTQNGTLVGFVIFPSVEADNKIVLEGYTYDDEYPQDEKDYTVSLNDLS
jgi:aryl-phospho-beta-D-glucosidase BglC (GH1 family)